MKNIQARFGVIEDPRHPSYVSHKLADVLGIFERRVDVRGWVSRKISYYVSSLEVSPQRLMELTREHWKLESFHWLLDVTFSEERCRFLEDNAYRTLNALRKLALTAHKRFLHDSHKKTSIKANMLACLLNQNAFSALLMCL